MNGRLSATVLAIGVAIAVIGSGMGYMVAESEHQDQGWIKVQVRNVGSEEMTVGLMVGGNVVWNDEMTDVSATFSAFMTILSANESLVFSLDVHWHKNNTFFVSAFYGNNATPDYYHSNYSSEIVRCIPGDVVNVTFSLNMAQQREYPRER